MATRTLTPVYPDQLVDDRLPFTIEDVQLDRMVVDYTYQRVPSRYRLESLTKHFDPSLAGTFKVNFRLDGTIALVDAQHRRFAAMKNGYLSWPCEVYRGLTLQQEADMFFRANTHRNPIYSWERFKARLAAEDPVAMEIKRLVEDYGFELALNGKITRPNQLKAMTALEKIYERYGGSVLQHTLRIVGAVWPQEEHNTHHSILAGLASFLDSQQGKLDGTLLIKRLRETTPNQLIRRALVLAEGRHVKARTASGVMMAIAEVYDYRRRTENRTAVFGAVAED